MSQFIQRNRIAMVVTHTNCESVKSIAIESMRISVTVRLNYFPEKLITLILYKLRTIVLEQDHSSSLAGASLKLSTSADDTP